MDIFDWCRDDSHNYFGHRDLPWGETLKAAVESLPDGGWDWVVWVRGEVTPVAHGVVDHSETACAAADALLCTMLHEANSRSLLPFSPP